jgi:predicted peptidase
MDRSIKNLYFLLIILVFLQVRMEAQEFHKHLFVNVKDTLPYNMLSPLGYQVYSTDNHEKSIDSVKYPLIIFFHGVGERGNDNEIQINHIKELFLNPQNQKKFPAFVIAPQCPTDKRWVESSWKVSKHIMPEKISVPLNLTIELIDKLISQYPIDEKRIYVTGLSMGGFGTWDIICRNPSKFAAAIPICGGGDTNKAKLLINTSIWAFHGSNDKVVQVILTRNMISAIKNAGGNPKYTEYPGIGHDSWKKAYKEKDLLEWLFKQSL